MYEKEVKEAIDGVNEPISLKQIYEVMATKNIIDKGLIRQALHKLIKSNQILKEKRAWYKKA